LWIIGNGSLRDGIPDDDRIVMMDFMQPNELAIFAKGGGVLVLPSRHEAWGVVLHEFAAAGFPIICSDSCGAADEFVRHGYNGFIFKTGDTDELCRSMVAMTSLTLEQRRSMGANSHDLSRHINPEISARSLLSAVK
jgi:glycosyltransferase involved in cell wall biosynthesis